MASPPRRVDQAALAAGPVALLILVIWLSGRTWPDQPSAFGETARVLLASGPWALGWLAAAAGLGWPLRRLVRGGGAGGPILQAGLGVAAMLILDAALGALGVLQWGGCLGAWALIVAGMALLVAQLWRNHPSPAPPPALVWTAAPAVAVLLVAACAAPGWLWATEFGGYDALSYHLQLPREWLAAGHIRGLHHNVYSFLPGYVEAAYYHLAILIGDGTSAVCACQLLHAGLTLLAAAAAARFAAVIGGATAGAVTGVVMLGTPWTIVVGSLGYNEMAVCLMLATGLLILAEDETPGAAEAPVARAAAIGLLAAAACGAKLTAAGFVALPLGVLLLAGAPRGRRLARVGAAGAAGIIALLPWLLRNWVWTGNPVFPFTPFLGLAHWTPQQAHAWMSGHVSYAGLGDRLASAWNEYVRYGVGPAPIRGQPWRPQWSVLPWLAAAGLAAQFATRRSGRGWSGRLALVLVVQGLFWLLLTHIKSRFMLPTVVPAAVAVGLGVAVARRRVDEVLDRLVRAVAVGLGAAVVWQRAWAQLALLPVAIALALLCTLWCFQPVVAFLREGQGAPAAMNGWVEVLTGDGLSPEARKTVAESFPSVYVNYELPPGSRTLMLGDAKPLYFRGDVAYQTTWDRGPLSGAMRDAPARPEQWLATLRHEGFTHVLIDTTMLDLWQRKGWNDPLITAPRVQNFADRFGTLEHDFGDGVQLYKLGPGPQGS